MNLRRLSLLLVGQVIVFMSGIVPVQSQLAITEVMTSAFDGDPANPNDQYPDYWELTNFGRDALPLAEYRFADDGVDFEHAETNAFQGLTIRSGESIIFMRRRTAEVVQSLQQFRAWWGDGQLPPGLQVAFYPRPGFSADGETIRLWRVNGMGITLADEVTVPDVADGNGISFTYDPSDGILGRRSVAGVGCAFKAALTPDIGSPGCAPGPVALKILRQPQSQTVDAGRSAEFMVVAQGLPKPQYQWRRNGVPIPAATQSTLKLDQVSLDEAADYTVELKNGIESLMSLAARLTVNIIPSCARITAAPSDRDVTLGQTVSFAVGVSGYPLPSIQWQFDGVNLPGETNLTLLVLNASLADAGLYTVRVTNPSCSTNATAVLSVGPPPNLVITEAMVVESVASSLRGFNDWWELTSFESHPVNLKGYAWDDFPGAIPGSVITNDAIIHPGESVIFLQEMSETTFRDWWGEENLPENLQFIQYRGNGFSGFGDLIRLWNPTSVDANDYVASVGFDSVDINDPSLTTFVRGISKRFDSGECEFGCWSVVGEFGAVRATGSDDIASPGYIANHPPRTVPPRCTTLFRDAQGVHFIWRTQAGVRYELQTKSELAEINWLPVRQMVAVGSSLEFLESMVTNAGGRFYRLAVIPRVP